MTSCVFTAVSVGELEQLQHNLQHQNHGTFLRCYFLIDYYWDQSIGSINRNYIDFTIKFIPFFRETHSLWLRVTWFTFLLMKKTIILWKLLFTERPNRDLMLVPTLTWGLKLQYVGGANHHLYMISINILIKFLWLLWHKMCSRGHRAEERLSDRQQNNNRTSGYTSFKSRRARAHRYIKELIDGSLIHHSGSVISPTIGSLIKRHWNSVWTDQSATPPAGGRTLTHIMKTGSPAQRSAQYPTVPEPEHFQWTHLHVSSVTRRTLNGQEIPVCDPPEEPHFCPVKLPEVRSLNCPNLTEVQTSRNENTSTVWKFLSLARSADVSLS